MTTWGIFWAALFAFLTIDTVVCNVINYKQRKAAPRAPAAPKE